MSLFYHIEVRCRDKSPMGWSLYTKEEERKVYAQMRDEIVRHVDDVGYVEIVEHKDADEEVSR